MRAPSKGARKEGHMAYCVDDLNEDRIVHWACALDKAEATR